MKREKTLLNKYRVGIIGATGMVGQRLVSLLVNHPWFEITSLAASSRSRGKRYLEAVGDKWRIDKPISEINRDVLDMVVLDAFADAMDVMRVVDLVFCAVDLPTDEVKKLESLYSNTIPVVSNNSANRYLESVPMVIPEINYSHLKVVQNQLKNGNGYIVTKSNCSIQSYVPLLTPLLQYGLEEVIVTTCQAVSGAGKTLDMWPEMNDNVIPFIKNEEHKSEIEPLKIWGHISDGLIKPINNINIHATCLRVPVSDGHMAVVTAKFKDRVIRDNIIECWRNFHSYPQELGLPSAPSPFIIYHEEDNRPQTALDRNQQDGMAISAGRLRQIDEHTVTFVGLSHNTLRGAAGGAVLLAEELVALNYVKENK